jgi:CRISPR/Cas system-associated protein Csm6
MITLDQLSPEVIDAIARRAVEQLSEKVVQEIAWEVVPQLAELLIKRQLEEKSS